MPKVMQVILSLSLSLGCRYGATNCFDSAEWDWTTEWNRQIQFSIACIQQPDRDHCYFCANSGGTVRNQARFGIYCLDFCRLKCTWNVICGELCAGGAWTLRNSGENILRCFLNEYEWAESRAALSRHTHDSSWPWRNRHITHGSIKLNLLLLIFLDKLCGAYPWSLSTGLWMCGEWVPVRLVQLKLVFHFRTFTYAHSHNTFVLISGCWMENRPVNWVRVPRRDW